MHFWPGFGILNVFNRYSVLLYWFLYYNHSKEKELPENIKGIIIKEIVLFMQSYITDTGIIHTV